jgi:hypothetical protein
MKRILTVSVVAFLFLCSATIITSQKTKEKHIIGKWKLHLDISNAVDEETKNNDDLGAVFARGIVSMVDDLVDEIDITFDFQKNNVLVVTQNSLSDYDEESIEKYTWKIDGNGYVVTKPVNKGNSSYDDGDGWILKKGKLIPVDEDENVVWMERVKK